MSKKTPPMAMLPRGLLGRAFGWIMERMNNEAYRKTLAALDLKPGHALLEIGFGTGAFLDMAAKKMGHGTIAGVDPSPLMVETARRRLRRHGSNIPFDLQCGDDCALPQTPGRFDRVIAIHAFQFWSDPKSTLITIQERLKSDGILCLALRRHGAEPPDWLPNPISRSGRETDELLEILATLGFAQPEHVARMSHSDIVRARV